MTEPTNEAGRVQSGVHRDDRLASRWWIALTAYERIALWEEFGKDEPCDCSNPDGCDYPHAATTPARPSS